MPLLVRKRGGIAAGGTSDVALTSEDFLPTFLEMAGVAPDRSQPLDGESLVPLLTQSGSRARRHLSSLSTL